MTDDLPSPWTWLDFIDPRKSDEQGFLGSVVVEGFRRDAILIADRLGCHPGNNSEVVHYPLEFWELDRIPDTQRNRWLDPAEAAALFWKVTGQRLPWGRRLDDAFSPRPAAQKAERRQ